MNLTKRFFAALTTAALAAALTIPVNAVGPGFSRGYIPFRIEGDEEIVTAVRTLDDFSWRGSMLVAAAVESPSLDDGTYYFHVEPVMDSDILRQFQYEYGYYRGMYLSDAELVDIDFWDADGNAISPEAEIYFQSDYATRYNAAFVYENGQFTPIDSTPLIGTFRITPPHYSRFVIASYSLHDPAPIGPVPDIDPPVPSPGPKPIDVTSKTDDTSVVVDPDPTPEPEPEPDPMPGPEPIDVPSDIGGESSEPDDEVSKDKPDNSTTEVSDGSDIELSHIGQISQTDSKTSTEPSRTLESNIDKSTTEVSRDTVSLVPNNNSYAPVSAPDGTAATGDNTTPLVFVVMSVTAGVTTMIALRKKKQD